MMATYIPNNLIIIRGFNASTILWITSFVAAIYAISAHFLGCLNDRIGRKPMIIAPIFLLMIIAYPLFVWFAHGGLLAIFIAEAILAILVCAATSALCLC